MTTAHHGHRIGRRLIAMILGVTASTASVAAADPAGLQLGIAHIGGLYSLTDQDYLNEGASAARAIGARCIKVSLTLDAANPTSKMYPFHSRWPAVETLDELAGTPYFRSLFSKDFDTFILVSFRPDKPPDYWRTEFTHADEQAEEACFASLTRALLESYADAGKTFVIQNWEGDWAVRGSFDPGGVPSDLALASMSRWLEARQRGVTRGRDQASGSRSRVLHACEVNLVASAMTAATPCVTTHVLPHICVDLVSYSAWDTKNSPESFGRAIDFIAARRQPTSTRVGSGVYIGEFGLPESEASPTQALERCRELVAKARDRDCPYAVYWQLYCNEAVVRPPRAAGDYKGFWLIRPDGTRSVVCELFQD